MYAKPRIVLLTALNFEPVLDFFNRMESMVESLSFYNANLERDVRDDFEPLGYEVVAQHEVNASDIHRTLRSGRNVAVFFVGHGAFGNESRLTDYFDNDVKPVFKDIHPNLRFLALVGCNTKKIISHMKNERSGYASDPRLEWMGFDGLVDAQTALWRARRAAKEKIREVDTSSCQNRLEVRSGYRVRIRRRVPQDFSQGLPGAVTLEMGTETDGLQFLAAFPPAWPGEIQEQTAWVQARFLKRPVDMKAHVRSGAQGSLHPFPTALGEFEFSDWSGAPSGAASWSAVGIDAASSRLSQRVYRYTGPSADPARATPYYPYSCVTFRRLVPVAAADESWLPL